MARLLADLPNRCYEKLITRMQDVGINPDEAAKPPQDNAQDATESQQSRLPLVSIYKKTTELGLGDLPSDPSYRIRSSSVITEDGDSTWSVKTFDVTLRAKKCTISVTLPPDQPLLVLVGKSHVRNMANLCFEGSKHQTMKQLWEKIVFCEIENTVPASMIAWWPKIYATLVGALSSKYKDLNHNSPVHFLVTAGSHINNKFLDPKRAAQEMMELAILMNTKCDGNLIFNSSVSFLELPIRQNAQVQSIWLNIIIREINLMSDTYHHNLNRIWKLILKPTEEGKNGAGLKINGMDQFMFDTDMYNNDGLHLSTKGYVRWLVHLIQVYCVGQSENPQMRCMDTPLFKTKVISVVDPKNGVNFFNSLLQVRHRVRTNSTDLVYLDALDVMEMFEIDVDKLKLSYPPYVEIEQKEKGGGKMISKKIPQRGDPYHEIRSEGSRGGAGRGRGGQSLDGPIQPNRSGSGGRGWKKWRNGV